MTRSRLASSIARSLATAILSLATLALGGPARAAQPSSTPAGSEWYGWQTLASDAVAAALLTSGGLMLRARDGGDDPAPGAVAVAASGMGTYALGAPIVHAAHRRYGAAGLSLAARVLAPGAVAGALGRGAPSAAKTSAILGAALVPVVLDAAWLARAPGRARAEIRTPYRGGALPPGARLERHPRWTLLAVGAGTFALTYVPYVGMAISCEPTRAGCAYGGAPLAIPIVGPLVHAAAYLEAANDLGREGAFAAPVLHLMALGSATLSFVQAGSLAVAAYAVASPVTDVVTRAPDAARVKEGVRSAVTITPLVSPTSVGLSVTW